MKTLLALLFIGLVLSAGHLMVDSKGYVLISTGQTTYEATLFSFGVLLVIGLSVLFAVVKLFKFWLRVALGTSRFFSNKRDKKAQQAWLEGLWALVHHNPKSALQSFQSVSLEPCYQDIQHTLAAQVAIDEREYAQAEMHLNSISDANQPNVALLWSKLPASEGMVAHLASLCHVKKPASHVVNAYLEALLTLEKQAEIPAAITRLHKQANKSPEAWQAYLNRLFALDLSQRDTILAALPRVIRNHAKPLLVAAKVSEGESELRPLILKAIKKKRYEEVSALSSGDIRADSEVKKALQHSLLKTPEQPDLLFSLACFANADKDHQLAAQIFDSLSKHAWHTDWSPHAMLAYEQTQQFEKAYLIAKS